MSNSTSDEDLSMDGEGEVPIAFVFNEDETVDSETGSDQSFPTRYSDDFTNSPVELAAQEENFLREDESTLEHPHLGIIEDVAAIVDVVSDGYSHQMPSLRTEAAASSSSANCSMSDFRPTKRAKLSNASEDSDEEAENCSICFVPWTNTGTHRLVCLKCGHLFGKSCILKWLKVNNSKCPQCNRIANRRDIRVLYARSIKMIDTSERDRAIQELEQEKEARKKAEMEAARIRLNYQMALAECNQMKQALEQQKQQLEVFRKMSVNIPHDPSGSQHQTSLQNPTQASYAFEKHLKIWEAGGCRVMAYSSIMTTLCVSQPSSSPLFPGFGVKKVLSGDFKSSQYVAIHSKAIRDLSFNIRNPDAILLSCSMDKTIKMTSLISNTVTHSYECSAPVWSCAWNLDDRNYFYAGMMNGVVNVFDMRNLSQSVAQLSAEGSCSPVNSLQYLPQTTGTKLRPGGLLVGQLGRSKFYERCSNGDYKLHLLTLEANLTSLSLEENTGHILATYRPTAKCPNIRHQISELLIEPVTTSEESQVMMCNCNTINTFHGGSTQKLLTRNRLMLDPSNDHDLLACTGDEASQSFQIWRATSGQLQQKIPTSDSVLDLCPVMVNDQAFLVALTDKQVSIYKHQPSLV